MFGRLCYLSSNCIWPSIPFWSGSFFYLKLPVLALSLYIKSQVTDGKSKSSVIRLPLSHQAHLRIFPGGVQEVGHLSHHGEFPTALLLAKSSTPSSLRIPSMDTIKDEFSARLKVADLDSAQNCSFFPIVWKSSAQPYQTWMHQLPKSLQCWVCSAQLDDPELSFSKIKAPLLRLGMGFSYPWWCLLIHLTQLRLEKP